MYKVSVGKKILSQNEEYAQRNSEFLRKKNKLCLNLISSPGSGKTTLLARTISQLRDKMKVGVIEGDIQTDIDAEKIRAAGAPATQINTEGACHLSAAQIARGLNDLPIDELDLVFIENVGNLVCPSSFELGETAKVAVLSVAEGDDKPAKYPAIFAKSKAMLINKIDMLEMGAEFDIEKVRADARKVNREIKIFLVSAKTGQGMEQWYNWLHEEIANMQKV